MKIGARTKFCLLVFFMALAVSGCKTLHSPARCDQPWLSTSKEIKKNVNDKTWSNIRCQKITESDKPLNLNALIDMALRKSPVPRQTWRKARAYEAALRQAESKLYPNVDVSGTLKRSKSHGSLGSSDTDELKYGPSADITYLLFDFGGRQASIEEAQEDLAAANYAFNQALQDTLLEVERSYYNLNSAKSALEAAMSNLEDSKKTYEAAQIRFEAGLSAKLDELQAKSDYENALYQLEETKAELRKAQASLALALGFPADYHIEITPPANKKMIEFNERDITVLIDEALSLRPDIASQKAALRSKIAAIKAANSNMYPSISLDLSAERNWYEDYENNRERSHDYDFGAAINIDWDAFDGYGNINAKKQAQELAQAEEEKLIEAELQASADVWVSFFNYQAAFKKLNYSKSYLSSANNSYELAFESYKSGLSSIIDVLDAQASLAQARSQLINSEEDLYMALSNLSHATGKLYRASVVDFEQELVNLNITEY